MPWRDELLVGNPVIDREHFEMVSCAAALEAAIAAGQPKPALERGLEELIALTRRHFTSEEGLMLASGYPLYHEHRESHRRLLEQLATVYSDFADGHAEASQSFVLLVGIITEQHMMFEDRQVATFLSRTGYRRP